MNYKEINEHYDTKVLDKEYDKDINGNQEQIEALYKTRDNINDEYINKNRFIDQNKSDSLEKMNNELEKKIRQQFRGCKVIVDIRPYMLEVYVNNIGVVCYKNKYDEYKEVIAPDYIELAKGQKILDMYFEVYGTEVTVKEEQHITNYKPMIANTNDKMYRY